MENESETYIFGMLLTNDFGDFFLLRNQQLISKMVVGWYEKDKQAHNLV